MPERLDNQQTTLSRPPRWSGTLWKNQAALIVTAIKATILRACFDMREKSLT